MISIRQLSKSYGQVKALDKLDLTIKSGVIFGLLGPNGAGKTTLVSVLNGLVDFQAGEVEVFATGLRENLAEIRRRSALVPQSPAFYEKLTVRENLNFFAGLQGIKGAERQRNLDYAIAVNHLEEELNQRADTLSGGLQRRLNLALGLLNDPELIYFDEPTVGIDPQARNQILATIRGFKEQAKTVIYTSHYLPEIERICDEVAIIDHGRIICQGELKSLLNNDGPDTALIELIPANRRQLTELLANFSGLELTSENTLLLTGADSSRMGELLQKLEQAQLAIKQIRYGSTDLELLFLRLTNNREAHD